MSLFLTFFQPLLFLSANWADHDSAMTGQVPRLAASRFPGKVVAGCRAVLSPRYPVASVPISMPIDACGLSKEEGCRGSLSASHRRGLRWD